MASAPMPRPSITDRLSTWTPPPAMAPMASSGWAGTPSLRTTRTSSGAPRATATSAATGTPPRGNASTSRCGSPARCSRAPARTRPASARSRNAMPPPFCPPPGAGRSRAGEGEWRMPDAVVIGAGHNGLVAAAMLADAGWSVAVLEAQPQPGGAVRTEELTLPGFRHDTFSAFYPFAVASPAIAALDLGAHGLRWRRSPLVLAHPTPDGRCVALSTDVEETAASLDAYAPGDGDSWRRMYRRWEDISRPL